MQGGTNGSKEKSSKEKNSKEKESSKEENSKEESSKEEKEGSKEENSKEENSKEEKEIIKSSLLFLTRPHGWVALMDTTCDHEVLFMGDLRFLCSVDSSLL